MTPRVGSAKNSQSPSHEDDGITWTDPVVIARQRQQMLSYSYLFEAEPGLLWILSGFGRPLRMSLREADFVGSTAPSAP